MNTIPILSYSVKTAVAATGYSRSYLYKAIQDGKLSSYRRGGRTFILADNLRHFILAEATAGQSAQGGNAA